MPAKITAIWYFCVTLTAWLPPSTVYRMTKRPLATIVRSSGQPRTVESTMAGA